MTRTNKQWCVRITQNVRTCLNVICCLANIFVQLEKRQLTLNKDKQRQQCNSSLNHNQFAINCSNRFNSGRNFDFGDKIRNDNRFRNYGTSIDHVDIKSIKCQWNQHASNNGIFLSWINFPACYNCYISINNCDYVRIANLNVRTVISEGYSTTEFQFGEIFSFPFCSYQIFIIR